MRAEDGCHTNPNINLVARDLYWERGCPNIIN